MGYPCFSNSIDCVIMVVVIVHIDYDEGARAGRN
jgi:hypothetical protein